MSVKPLLEGRPPLNMRFYGVIATVLVICILMAAFISLQPSSQLDSSSVPTVQPTSTPSASNNLNDTGTINATTNTNSQAKSELLTKEDALAIAMPIIEQYAAENNRTLTDVDVSFNPAVKDINGFRGEPDLNNLFAQNATPGEIIKAQNKAPTYPAWGISVGFERTPDIVWGNPQYWVVGYSVCIWADTKQIYYSNPDGVM
ncbi:MAG: hypothetical protein NWE92_10375 [Candidatus Bathyarchaeota archaeon]|nr:hypothetical protein [Candidatus Bathyarchaeota archaeon]